MNKTRMKNHRPLLFLLGIAFAMQACGPLRDVVIPDIDEEVSVSGTLSEMNANKTDFSFFSTRFSGQASLNGDVYDVSGTIRIRKDSAIYVSVSPFLGIEVARMIVTPEEVRFLNRLEGLYFIGGMDFVNRMLGTNLDYYMLQALLVGNDFDHFSTDNFRARVDDGRYLLQNPERRLARQSQEGFSFQQNLWLDPESFRITENLLYEPGAQRSLRARYSRFNEVENQKVPGELTLRFIDRGNRADLDLRYSRTSINDPQPMHFSIPDRYRPMH